MTDLLDATQLGFFRAFGYLVLPGFLAPKQVLRLKQEVEHGVRAAAGDTFASPERAGLNGHYLPLTDEGSPLSASLPTDPRFTAIARQLLGPDIVPDYGMGILYFSETGWHTDHRWPLATVKFVTYFDELVEGCGALVFLPGSGSERNRRLIGGYRSAVQQANPERSGDAFLLRLPGVPVPTRPGDVVAISGHVWHASFGGRNRWSWTLSFARAPTSARQSQAFARMLRDLTFWPRLEWSAAGYPFYSEYWHDRTQHCTPQMWARMNSLGIFEAARKVESAARTRVERSDE